MRGYLFKINNCLSPPFQLVEYFCLSGASKSAEYFKLKWLLKSLQDVVTIGLIPACKSIDLKTVKVQEPGDSGTAHASAPAVDENFGFRVLSLELLAVLCQGFYLFDHFTHFGGEEVEADFDGLFPALLFIGGAYDLSFFIGEQREAYGSRDMCMIVFGRRTCIEQESPG